MTYYISKTQARQNARNDLTIFREINALMEQVITDSENGLYSTTVSDGTTMTECTPSITITGTIANPTITGTPTLIVGSNTIILGTSGTNLNSVIADINDAGVAGLVASKNTSSNLVLTYTAPAATTWSLTVGAGTANTDLGLADNTTHTATNPSSVDYYSAWQGNITSRANTDQMRQVISYFEDLGYAIERQTNSSTNKTFQWVINY